MTSIPGVVVTRERCRCGKAYKPSKGVEPLVCPTCHQRPTTYYISVYWKGRARHIKLDRVGERMFSFDHARRTLEVIRAEIEEGRFDPAIYHRQPNRTFGQYWQVFLREYPAGTSTRDKLNAIATQHLTPMMDWNLRDIRGVEVKEWWLDLADKVNKDGNPLSPKYRADILQWLRRFFSAAMADDAILIDPTKGIKTPKLVKRKIQHLTIEEQDAALEKIPNYDQPIFEFLFLTGCRVMEAAALRQCDLAPNEGEHGLIYIQATIDRHGRFQEWPKNRTARVIPMIPDIRACISRATAGLRGGWVFANKWGRHYSYEYLRDTWCRACSEAGIPEIQLKNATRHSLGMRLIREGYDIWVVSKILGHTTTAMTENYAALHEGGIAGALDRGKATVHKLDANSMRGKGRKRPTG